jgi:hypothetical protein
MLAAFPATADVAGGKIWLPQENNFLSVFLHCLEITVNLSRALLLTAIHGMIGTLSACGGGGGGGPAAPASPAASTTASTSSTTTPPSVAVTPTPAPTGAAPEALPGESYSAATQYASSYCQDGVYPSQWDWNPATVVKQDAPATSGTPRIVQMRDGVAIATFSAFGGDAARSRPNSENGTDTSVGPFRRSPYTQWKSGDVFLVYPAVYSGADMQLYIGPNVANDADYSAGKSSVPSNITIRGVTVDGKRPVIVNPATGASNATYGQGLIYIDGVYDSTTRKISQRASNITIENLDIVDSPTGGYIGKAAIYINGGQDITLRKVRISGFKQHSANGIFSTGNTAGTLLLENVELDSNGGAGGPEHNAYIGASNSDPMFTFKVSGSWSHDAYYGHLLKSRAQRTIVEGSYLTGQRAAPGQQTETYLLDVPDGGELTVRNTIFVKNYSGNNSNGGSLTFGVESASASRSWGLTVEHNTFVAMSRYYDDAQHKPFPLFISGKALGDKKIDSNLYVGYCNGDVTRDAPGTNALTAGFNDIDLSYRPRVPSLTGNTSIIGTTSYWHQGRSATRKTNAVGARD